MLVDLVVVFGLVVMVQLYRVGSALHQLVAEVREARAGIERVLLWHKEATFAHALGERLEEIPKDVVEELQWHRDHTFAHDLREWIYDAAKDVADGIGDHLSSIGESVAKIEENTSRE